MNPSSTRVVLASASAIRRTMLENAGVIVAIDPADIDEGRVKDELRASGGTVEEAALRLAREKSSVVSARHAGALGIGSDQMLECDSAWLEIVTPGRIAPPT